MRVTIHTTIDPRPVRRARQGGARRADGRTCAGSSRARFDRCAHRLALALAGARARSTSPGTGLAVLVNANAKRGGRRVAVQIARALPGASVRLTKSAQRDRRVAPDPSAAARGPRRRRRRDGGRARQRARPRDAAGVRPLPTMGDPAARDRERLGARPRRAEAPPLPRAARQAHAGRCPRAGAASSRSKGRSRTSPARAGTR